MSILIADLSGYTALTETHGGASAAQMVQRYLSLVARALSGTSRLVERVGDEVVIVADTALDALGTALQLQALADQEEHFLAIHAGLHTGEVWVEEQALFGTPLNLTARMAALSRAGQLLCSAELYAEVGSREGLEFKSIGKHHFKNLKQSVEVFEIRPTALRAERFVDPVCRMCVEHREEAYPLRYQDQTYYFCSLECRQQFAAFPLDYL